MALPDSISSREFKKFKDVGGIPAVRVSVVEGGGGGGGGTSTNYQLMLAASDHVKAFTWADFGTTKERVTLITHTAPVSVPGITIYQTFAYTLSSGKYRLDSITWSEV